MGIKADSTADITGVVCPMTFVKAKVALEEMEAGQVLELRIKAGEAIQNVPRSLKEEGHKIIQVLDNGDSTFLVYVVKDGLA